MTNPTWETVNIPTTSDSPFLKWGDMAGQTIRAVVLEFGPAAGRDFDGEPAPRIDLQIVAPGGYNIQDGQQVPLEPGDKVTWQGSTPIRLAQGLQQASPVRGDLIELSHQGSYRTPQGTGKDIQIRIARQAGLEYLPATPAPQAPAEDPWAKLGAPTEQPKDAWANMPKPQNKPPF